MTTDPEPGDVVALLTAHLAGDEQAVNTMLDLVDTVPLFAMTVGFFVELVGTERLQEALDNWRTRQVE